MQLQQLQPVSKEEMEAYQQQGHQVQPKMCIRQNFQLKQTEVITQRLNKPSTSQNGDMLKEQSADSIDALQQKTKDDFIIADLLRDNAWEKEEKKKLSSNPPTPGEPQGDINCGPSSHPDFIKELQQLMSPCEPQSLLPSKRRQSASTSLQALHRSSCRSLDKERVE